MTSRRSGCRTTSLRTEHIQPALARAGGAADGGIEIETVDQYGTPPVDPEVSIVVPLYRQMEYLEYQMAQFVHDPEIRAADLIYVLDSPEDADHLRLLGRAARAALPRAVPRRDAERQRRLRGGQQPGSVARARAASSCS